MWTSSFRLCDLSSKWPVAWRHSFHSSDTIRVGDHSSGTVRHVPSPRFLYSVYVLIALALGEYRVIDRSADPKGKLQLAVF